MRCAHAVFAVTLVLALACTAMADWETVGGTSHRDGRGPFVGPDDATLRWQVNNTALFAGQIYVDNGIAAMMRFNSISYSPILCLDANTGDQLWTLDLPGPSTRSLVVGFRDNQVYALGFQETNHDTLYALDPADGSVIWIADVGIKQGIIASAAFASNGDLIVNGKDPDGSYLLTRINRFDGSVVWSTPRVVSVIGGSEHVAVHGDRVYGWTGGIGQVEFTTWDLDTGQELYSISLPGDGDQEIPFTVASEQAIYIIRDGGDLFRLQDDGNQFVVRWQVPVDFGTIPPIGCHFGVLSNGDVIVPHGTFLRRHSFNSGAVVAESDPLTGGGYLGYPRFAIDDNDVVYCGTSTSDGQLVALDPADLAELWSATVPNIHYSGPAVGDNGDILVAGNGGVLCFEGVEGGQPPLITLAVDPVGGIPPVVPRGGSFQYNLEMMVGPIPQPQVADLWTDVILPNGSPFGPVYQTSFLFAPGLHIDVANITQFIPFFAPQGIYEWRALAGLYPGFVAAMDSFEFEVTVPTDVDADGTRAGVSARTGAAGFVPQSDHVVWTTDQPVPTNLAGALSGTDHGTTVASASAVPANPDLDVQIYPNPANAATTLTISVSEAQRVTVVVTDILGREVARLDAGVVHPGGARVGLDVRGWASGSYLVSLTGERGTQATRRITVMK